MDPVQVVQLLIGKHQVGLAAGRIHQVHVVRVLLSVDVLYKNLIAAVGPLHSRDVVVTRVAGHGSPGGVAGT